MADYLDNENREELNQDSSSKSNESNSDVFYNNTPAINNSESEYRADGNHTQNSYAQTVRYAVPPKKKPIAAIVAVLCVITILFSGAAGFAGAYVSQLILSDGHLEGPNGYNQSAGGKSEVVLNKEVTTIVNQRGETEALSIEEVAAIVCDSVVEIATEFRTVGYFNQVIGGAGSGVVISEDGYIITNNHVIADTDNNNDLADSITVRLTSGESYPATIIGTDEDSDIAVIKIEASGLVFATFGDSDSLVVGQEVVAVGNPLGTLGGTVTNGIISALDRAIDVDGNVMSLLQTNAAVNPGNSGGGLFDLAGNLIGVVNAKSSGTGIEGLGFAIPSNYAYSIASELIEYGYVRGKVYLGVSFADVTSSAVAMRYFGSSATGVYVVETLEGYNDNSLMYGDRIIAINGTEVTSYADISAYIKGCSVGDEIEFTLYRSRQLITVTVVCYEKIPDGISFGD